MKVLKRILRRVFCKHDYLLEAEVTNSGITERTLICYCKKCGKPNRFFSKILLTNALLCDIINTESEGDTMNKYDELKENILCWGALLLLALVFVATCFNF